MKRGDVFWVNFDPAQGGEIRKSRPAVIVSNDMATRILNRVQVVPLSSKTARVYPAEAIVSVNGVPQKAMADQIRTVAKARLSNQMGMVSTADMLLIDGAIRRQLGL